MSWTDYESIKTINKIREQFDIKTFVETGTFRGVNAEIHAQTFDRIITCELVDEYYEIAKKRLDKYSWVQVEHNTSPNVLKQISHMFNWHPHSVFVYLDAHFYDPKLKPEDRWVVLKELEALRIGKINRDEFIIAIHDFDNGELGHLTYDGQPLNFDLLKDELYKLNSEFYFYTNTKEQCDIVTEEKMKEYYPYVEIDDVIKDSLKYVWSSPEKTYRGILYCVPYQLDLTEINLRPL